MRAPLQQCNCYNVYDAAMPFGGYKASGVGRDKGEEALHNFTQTKVRTCTAIWAA
jgi:phenylacetaldehyde dehydrogenase